MAFEIPKTLYSGKIREITLGKGDKAITVGGETSYPFYLFEGEMPNPAKIAMEVWDCLPDEWAEAALEPFQGVTDDPVAWAKKCIDDYKAEIIALQLISTDPNGLNRGADEAAEVVKKESDALHPLTLTKSDENIILKHAKLDLNISGCQSDQIPSFDFTAPPRSSAGQFRKRISPWLLWLWHG